MFVLQTSIHVCSENLAAFLQLIIVTAKTTSVNGRLSKKVTWYERNVKTAADDTARKSLWSGLTQQNLTYRFPPTLRIPHAFDSREKLDRATKCKRSSSRW